MTMLLYLDFGFAALYALLVGCSAYTAFGRFSIALVIAAPLYLILTALARIEHLLLRIKDINK